MIKTTAFWVATVICSVVVFVGVVILDFGVNGGFPGKPGSATLDLILRFWPLHILVLLSGLGVFLAYSGLRNESKRNIGRVSVIFVVPFLIFLVLFSYFY